MLRICVFASVIISARIMPASFTHLSRSRSNQEKLFYEDSRNITWYSLLYCITLVCLAHLLVDKSCPLTTVVYCASANQNKYSICKYSICNTVR